MSTGEPFPLCRPLGSGAGRLRSEVTVGRFLAEEMEALQLSLLRGGEGLGRKVPEAALNRPGLALAGFYDFFAPKRLQIIGKHEHSYLAAMEPELRVARLRAFFEQYLPGVILCRSLEPFAEMLSLADEFSTPLLSTPMQTCLFVNAATLLMEDLVGLHEVVHGTMCDVHGTGVILVGEAGIGKSETALGLIKRGHALISDDTTMLRRDSSGRIMASAVEQILGFMEIRGIGIIHVPSVFGITAMRGEKQLELVLTLERPSRAEPYIDRTGETKWHRLVLGLQIPELVVPMGPARDIANFVETAVCEYRLRGAGYSATKELDKRIISGHAKAKTAAAKINDE